MSIKDLLLYLEENSKTQREKGTLFENTCKLFLLHDKTYAPQFSTVQTYAEWAEEQEGPTKRDIGIDLVATNSLDNHYTAIQCKFLLEDSKVAKKEIDSFIAASVGSQFNRRVFFDTTTQGITNNVLEQIQQAQDQKFTRIGLDELENSSIDWSEYINRQVIEQKSTKTIRPHQLAALQAVKTGFETADRGKMLMACGTGKTFTALKIAEELAGKDKSILFLAPSLALLSQAITEWTIESDMQLHAFAVCSDVQVGKRKVDQDDVAEINIHDLAYPATTDAKMLSHQYGMQCQNKMKVIFATYQSIEVISKAQKEYGLPEFDLIICDEAHRTTGATLAGEIDSHFVKIHNQEYIQGKKRLYMTATPRVYITQVKQTANERGAILYSMDDEDKFGKELYTLKFGAAVEQNLLSDYKVLVLAVDENVIAKDMQDRFAQSDSTLMLDDAAKMVGCYKALLKIGIEDTEGKQPMRRVVSFCRRIKDSKLFRDEFEYVIQEGYKKSQDQYSEDQLLDCEIEHVDGTMNTAIRNNAIRWLKKDHQDKACRILTNARCLSEGVDVPSLDAVLFVHSRKSKVDIVQSVGRVMRKAEGKQLGYIILPIVVPPGIEPEEALNNNKKYAIVWDVLNALRSHDERLDSEINRIEFGGISNRIEVISEVKDLPARPSAKETSGIGGEEIPSAQVSTQIGLQQQLDINYKYDSTQRAILAKIVNKCGTRNYWEDWADDVAEIAQRHIVRINASLEKKESEAYQVFYAFWEQLKKSINSSISKDDVVEMLAQHMITKPVFDALFSEYDFNANNPVSQAIQEIINILDKQNIGNEAQKLESFYTSIKARVAGIDSDLAKQKIIVELYDKFFRGAFPKLTERLGIVYTPVECVDFIIHSVNDVLKAEFNQSLADKNTQIIDPFTGTGTFITRLLQSGLIPPDKLYYKFKHELHANEIVLLAYYIASINIESTYHSLISENQRNKDNKIDYQPFEGICLTDTFELYEQDKELITPKLPVNSKRLSKQKKLEIKVIIGNPPYSAGQESATDNNQNVSYPNLDTKIKKNYVQRSLHKGNKNSLYDSYIRAICWASQRIGDAGVIGFITNAGWIDSNSADGMRKTLEEEFSSIRIFHLRGDARTNGEIRKKEGGGIFEGGSRAPIAISILVKNPKATDHGKIYFHDIGDGLDREEKLRLISEYKNINGIANKQSWRTIQPNQYYDWVNQRDNSFYEHISIGDKKTGKQAIFVNYSRGLGTSRDAWIYNYSKKLLELNVKNTIDFYNQERGRYHSQDRSNNIEPKKFVNNDSTKIAWDYPMLNALEKNKVAVFESNNCILATYRPFQQIHCYFSSEVNNSVSQMPKIFPESGMENLVIAVSGKGNKSFSCLMSKQLTDLHVLESGTQCFPFKLYEPVENLKTTGALSNLSMENHEDNIITSATGKRYRVSDGVSDNGLKYFVDFYKDQDISKEDLLYYLYGLLHSRNYCTRFADNLSKDLPHIPRVKNVKDFWLFSHAGRKLADLHINYEDKEPYEVSFEPSKIVVDKLDGKDFYVEKMRFLDKKDKSTIIYNDQIKLTNIPLDAYEYVVNGRSAVEWIMDRQKISTHKESKIENNPNNWAQDTMNNPRYPLDLLLKIITVSVESVKIINALPPLDL